MSTKNKIATKCVSGLPFGIGDCVLIRTVTMIQLGRVVEIGEKEIVLEDGGWVASTVRFGETLATGKLDEFERAPSWICVGRGAIVDIYPWNHALPQESK
jgi:hypothetical protein